MTAHNRTAEVYEEAPSRSMMDWIRLTLGILAIAALVTFFFQNMQRVEVHFLWFDWTTRMIWALIASALVGALAAAAFATLRARSLRRQRRQQLEQQA